MVSAFPPISTTRPLDIIDIQSTSKGIPVYNIRPSLLRISSDGLGLSRRLSCPAAKLRVSLKRSEKNGTIGTKKKIARRVPPARHGGIETASLRGSTGHHKRQNKRPSIIRKQAARRARAGPASNRQRRERHPWPSTCFSRLFPMSLSLLLGVKVFPDTKSRSHNNPP